jgi:hypothetical protein
MISYHRSHLSASTSSFQLLSISSAQQASSLILLSIDHGSREIRLAYADRTPASCVLSLVSPSPPLLLPSRHRPTKTEASPPCFCSSPPNRPLLHPASSSHLRTQGFLFACGGTASSYTWQDNYPPDHLRAAGKTGRRSRRKAAMRPSCQADLTIRACWPSAPTGSAPARRIPQCVVAPLVHHHRRI